MTHHPAFLFYPKDWLSDVRVRMLTPEQRCYFLELRCYVWNAENGLPCGAESLGRLVGLSSEQSEEILPEVIALFETKKGRIYDASLESQKSKLAESRLKASEKAKKSWEVRQSRSNAAAYAPAQQQQCCGNAFLADANADANESAVISDGECEGKPSRKPKADEPDGFAEFYDAYPKHVGRATAAKCWRKLAPDADLRRRIGEHVAAMAQTWDWQKDGGQFVPHPATYLNGKRWEDALPKSGSGPQRPQQSTIPLNAPSTIDPSLDFPDDLPAGLEFCHESARSWAIAMGTLADKDPDEYEAWLKSLRFLGVFGSTCRWAIACPDKTVCNWVSSMWRDAIEEAAGAPGLAFRLSFIVRPTE